VIALLADVVLLVVAVALGGVDGNFGRAAGALVAPVAVGNGVIALVGGFVIRKLRYSPRMTTPIASFTFPRECALRRLPPDRSAIDVACSPLYYPFMYSLHSSNHEVQAPA